MSIADKITSITGHLEDDYTALETLGVSVEDRNIKNIKDMANQIYAKFPKTNYEEGSNITLSNTLKGKLDFENDIVGYGDIKQEGTPTPDNPQEIEVVTGTQEVVERGKNLLNTANGSVAYKPEGTITIDSKGVINASIDMSYASINIPSITLKAGKTYTFKRNFTGSRNSWFVDTNNNNVLGIGYNQTSATLTPESDIIINKLNGALLSGDNYFWLEEGSTATDYEPYQTPQTYQLSLGEYEFAKIGNYVDTIEYDVDEDKVYKNENVNEHIFTENENISLQSINSYGIANFFIPHSLGGVSALALCNYFSLQTSGISVTQEEGFLWQHNGVYFRIKSSTASDVSSFKTWLGSHSVKVEYALAETSREEITGTLKDQIKALYNSHSFTGTTIIEIDGQLPLIIKVRALKGE